MSKEAIRQAIKARLKALPSAERQAIEADFYAQVLAHPFYQEAKSLAVTLSMGLEWETRPLIQAAWASGKQVLIPKVLSKEVMVFVPYGPNDPLKSSAFGIQEPLLNRQMTDQIDLMLVPGLAFDPKTRCRIGFGGGYYDRYLAQNPPRHSLALVHPCQLVAFEPEAFDWPLEALILSRK